MARHKLIVYLDDEDFALLKAHAESRKRSPEEDLGKVAANRLRALHDYAEKLTQKNATFRAYAPKGLPDDERSKLKALAAEEGIAPEPVKKEPRKKREKKGKKREFKQIARVANIRVKDLEKAVRSTTLKDAIRGHPVEPVKKGKHGARVIDLYDGAEVAVNKAKYISEESGRAVKDILKDNGRDGKGRVVKAS